MQLFKTFWCEDNIGDFKKEIKLIKNHCKRHQRAFEFDHYDFYPEELTEELFTGQYSLMLIDLNLKNEQKGTEVIEIIRNYGAYVDVLLYSNNPKELYKVTQEENYVEGVFIHAGLKGLGQKIRDVIDQIMYKENMAIHRNETYLNSKEGDSK
ncbi:hypothetical protein [Gracilimonas sp.]|uniref:hypothetical protein n=1 Tax=Gracilimonas sp. TaxID=1974203 RepID=UPI003D0DC353